MKYYAMPLISGKHYCKHNLKFDYIEAEAFKDIYDKTDARVIGYIRLKETNKNPPDTMVIPSNNQTHQYKIEHDKLSHIMGYILVADDTYIAVKKSPSLWPTVFCAIAALGIAIFMLWKAIAGAHPSLSAHIIETSSYEAVSVNNQLADLT